jgi:hypothetical protein
LKLVYTVFDVSQLFMYTNVTWSTNMRTGKKYIEMHPEMQRKNVKLFV